MSIRELAKQVLSNSSIHSKLDQLKSAHSQINFLPLGQKQDLIWSLPLCKSQNPIKVLSPEVKFLHSIANIELMAIYLYWDTIAMIEAPLEFYSDLASIAIEECEHFLLLFKRLEELGTVFPAYECKDYMAEFNKKTENDILARILYVSLYSEGRAIDSKERILNKLRGYNKDLVSYNLLNKIINDEVGHLRNGVKWFKYFAKVMNKDLNQAHQDAMNQLGLIYRAPFNKELRDLAGVPEEWYLK